MEKYFLPEVLEYVPKFYNLNFARSSRKNIHLLVLPMND